MKAVKRLEPKKILKKRSKIPHIFFAFFGVVLLVNISYIYISQKTWRGVVTKDSYQKGLNYNDTLKQAENQKALGWQVNSVYRPSSNGGNIMVDVKDKRSTQIEGATIYANFKRPAQEGFDFGLAIPFHDGVYQSDIIFPLKGQWDAEIRIVKGSDVFIEVKRYVIQ